MLAALVATGSTDQVATQRAAAAAGAAGRVDGAARRAGRPSGLAECLRRRRGWYTVSSSALLEDGAPSARRVAPEAQLAPADAERRI